MLLTVINFSKSFRLPRPQIDSSCWLLRTFENISKSRWTIPRLQSFSVIFSSIWRFTLALSFLLDLLRMKSSTYWLKWRLNIRGLQKTIDPRLAIIKGNNLREHNVVHRIRFRTRRPLNRNGIIFRLKFWYFSSQPNLISHHWLSLEHFDRGQNLDFDPFILQF